MAAGPIVPAPERPPVAVPPGADSAGPTAIPLPILRQPIAPPTLARARGWMPLSSIGIPAFLGVHPGWDGRGVLIGILDSGLDPGGGGFDSTSAGRVKLLDLRDFSGEGRVALEPVTPRGDTLRIAGHDLAGMGRIRALTGAGQLFAGVLRERALGEAPASDVNDNGTDGDTLAVVVGKASDGWVLFADTDGDGSLADERAVHDYLVAREAFGWHRGGEPPPLTLAANFSEQNGNPGLDLFFDTSAHGTHVAGIAAGRGIAFVPGFDGAAPGAQVLGLKIARDDFGGITTTGSVLAAAEYAMRFARAHAMPLVLNMSFGVGNAEEGTARLDALLDSVLTAHPDVVFVTSAGNDGPGESTMGFPGSARRAITVGATEPASLAGLVTPGARGSADALIYFSARGGELAKPDVVVPGVAYSAVPRWNMGDEVKGGTSMASPLVAGMAAMLLSGAQAERRAVAAEDVRRALAASARPLGGESPIDAGAGVPDLTAAWAALRGSAPAAEFDVEVSGHPGYSAAYQVAPGPADTLVRFRLVRWRGSAPLVVTLSSDAPWLTAPRTLRLDDSTTEVTLVQHPPLNRPGRYVGQVRATMPGVSGPLFTLISTVIVPRSDRPAPVRVQATVAGGGAERVRFPADSGRPFQVRISTTSTTDRLVAALHQPGGAPILGDNGVPAGADTAEAVFDIDNRDAIRGLYEAVAVAPAGVPLQALIAVDHAPIALTLKSISADSLILFLRTTLDTAVTGHLRAGMIGGERRATVSGTGGGDVLVPIGLPSWVRRVVIDLDISPTTWPRFTDFGFTLLDADGRILGKNPVNYPRARLEVSLPASAIDRSSTLVLSPGFAEPGSAERWTAGLSIRLEAEQGYPMTPPEGVPLVVDPRSGQSFHAVQPTPSWTLPAGFQPLGLFLWESGSGLWSWEWPLQNPPA